jgi:PAS domain S-box-containing protein
VIEFRLDGTIIAANERFLALMEYRAEDILGRHHRIFVQPEYVATQEYSRFWQALNRGEFQAGEFQRFTRNGNAVWMQATYTPILGLDGKLEKVVKFATNITERIAAERQLKTLNETLSKSLEVSRQRDADNSALFEVTAFLQASLTEDEVHDLVGRNQSAFRQGYGGTIPFRRRRRGTPGGHLPRGRTCADYQAERVLGAATGHDSREACRCDGARVQTSLWDRPFGSQHLRANLCRRRCRGLNCILPL